MRKSSIPTKLSKTFVETRKQPGVYHDGLLTGFQLVVTNASKIYRVRAKLKGASNKVVKVIIGRHGDPWTVNQAREAAHKYLLEIRQGINPNDRQREEQAKNELTKKQRLAEQKRQSITLQIAFDDYVKNKKLKPSTMYSYRCDFEKCLVDWLSMPITEITPTMVNDCHKEISKHHPGQTNHVMRILRAVLNYVNDNHLEDHGRPLILNNPVKRLSKTKRWNVLLPRQDIIYDHQLKDWLAAVKKLENPIVSDYLLFTLLTGLRKEEAAGLLWDNVDFSAKMFTVKDTKNRRDHTLPLTGAALQLLKRREDQKENEYIFPGRGKDGHLKDIRHHLTLVKQQAGFDFKIHTLRRTFTTIAARMLPDYIVRRLTNHIDKSDTTQGYVVLEVEKLREPLIQIEKHIFTCNRRV